MANYTAKDLRNITKDELVELLKKEGIEFDPTTSFFALRALLLNGTKNNDSENGESENGETENNESENSETPNPDAENNESVMSDNGNTENNDSENKDGESEDKDGETENKPKPATNALNALRMEVVKRRGGVGLGKSAFAAELAKRRGERVTPITFAQELKSRQLKYKGGK